VVSRVRPLPGEGKPPLRVDPARRVADFDLHAVEWAACVAGGYRDGLAGKALLAADSVVAEVRERVPDPASLTALLERRRREGRVSGTSEEEIAEFSDEAIRERQAENLRNDLDWAGKLRRCPRCSVVFASVRDRGACPGCGHVFYASRPEEGGR
jgi:ribosomal protein S27AE